MNTLPVRPASTSLSKVQ
uniref:Uncharacterized protein n=1 Tax=Arundo donax TaxID=35708 RepID=A0A0A8Z1W5_ARUDO